MPSPESNPRPAKLTIARVRRGRFSRWLNQMQVGWRATRRDFTRENIVSNLYTLAFVAPLSVLIWVIAENQQTQPEHNVPIQIAVKSDDPARRLATLATGETPYIQIDISGSEFAVQKIKDDAAQARLRPIDIVLHGTGMQRVGVLNQIAQDHLFTSLGVEVLSCSPQDIAVRVDPIDEVEVNVIADAPGLSSTAFAPSKVTMRGPRLNAIKQAVGLNAIVDLNSDPTLKVPGIHKDVRVKLIPPASLDQEIAGAVTITPDTVLATITVQEPDVERQWSGVQLREDAAPDFIKSNSVNFLPNSTLQTPVTVVGPPSDMKLFDNSFAAPKIFGYVRFDSSQTSAPDGMRQISFFRIYAGDGSWTPLNTLHIKEPYPSVQVEVSGR